jgi:hypothetical protein
MAAYKVSLVVHTGDLVSNGNSTDDWRTFFNVEKAILSYHHFLPAIGNHESPYWPYDTLFPLPDSEDYYSVNYGNAHFVVLNSYIDLYGVQRDWLIADLYSASTDPAIDWIFVALHNPPYSSGYHGSALNVRNAWCRIFEDYGVDIVFSGHDHNYERTNPINGVIYVVTCGGGAPLRNVGTSSWTAHSEKAHHFCQINIAGSHLFLRAIKPDGSVFDSLVIQRAIGVGEYAERGKVMMMVSPNPFADEVMIQYSLPRSQHVFARVYDSAGRYVKTLINAVQQPGAHTATWYGDDDQGNAVDAGSYYLIFIPDGTVMREKVTRIVR